MADPVDICEELTGYPLSKVVVFDTETTGTNPWAGDELLSISIVDGYGNDLFTSYVRPTRHKSWPDAQRVNGISPRMVRSAPTAREIAEDVRGLLAGNVLVVGYNVGFDIGFLTNQGILSREPLSRFDVMHEYADVVLKGGSWVKLSELARRYGYRFKAHDAAEDAMATAFCFRSLLTDADYLRNRQKYRYGGYDAMREPNMGQVKETTANVLALVDSGVTDVKGELRLGEVTRGKTKGAKRYEAYVGDSRVGVGETGWVETAMKFYDTDKPPKSIPCKLSLAASPSRSSCHVKITARGKYAQRLERIAAASKESWGMIPRADGRTTGIDSSEERRAVAEAMAQLAQKKAEEREEGSEHAEAPKAATGRAYVGGQANAGNATSNDDVDGTHEKKRLHGLRGLFRRLRG